TTRYPEVIIDRAIRQTELLGKLNDRLRAVVHRQGEVDEGGVDRVGGGADQVDAPVGAGALVVDRAVAAGDAVVGVAVEGVTQAEALPQALHKREDLERRPGLSAGGGL